MADIVNLNKVRKAKTKQRQSAQAAENRIVFGLSTKVRKAEREKHEKEAHKLDQNVLISEVEDKKG